MLKHPSSISNKISIRHQKKSLCSRKKFLKKDSHSITRLLNKIQVWTNEEKIIQEMKEIKTSINETNQAIKKKKWRENEQFSCKRKEKKEQKNKRTTQSNEYRNESLNNNTLIMEKWNMRLSVCWWTIHKKKKKVNKVKLSREREKLEKN